MTLLPSFHLYQRFSISTYATQDIMQPTSILFILASAVSVQANCKNLVPWGGPYRDCYWDPCGSSRQIGNDDGTGYKVIATTEQYTGRALAAMSEISQDCYKDYGIGCLSGYSSLFCQKGPGEKNVRYGRMLCFKRPEAMLIKKAATPVLVRRLGRGRWQEGRVVLVIAIPYERARKEAEHRSGLVGKEKV